MNYTDLSNNELLGILDDAHSWADVEVDPCFRELCGRCGIDYDEWDFNARDCDCLYDLLVERCQANGSGLR